MEITSSNMAFSGLQDAYDKSRPTYPEAALRYILGITPTTSEIIADIGCGTGILTRQLRRLYSNARIMGFDINADMIAQAQAVDANYGESYFVSTAENLPIEDKTLSMVFVAQAIQWFDRPAFFKEARRILKKDYGILVLIENNRDWQNSSFLSDYENLLETHCPNYSRHYREHDYKLELQRAGFLETKSFEHNWQRVMAPSQFRTMAISSTKMQAAIAASNGEVTKTLDELLAANSPVDGKIEIAYRTIVLSASNSN